MHLTANGHPLDTGPDRFGELEPISPSYRDPEARLAYAEQNDLQFAVPGGLIGVGTRIDPTLTRADRLVGQVLGIKGKLPHVFAEIEISYYLLRRLLHVRVCHNAACRILHSAVLESWRFSSAALGLLLLLSGWNIIFGVVGITLRDAINDC